MAGNGGESAESGPDDGPKDGMDDLIAGRYRRISHIGSGGMGVVWKAEDEVLKRTVALKELAPRAVVSLNGDEPGEAARRAMREARIAARLHHPNVIAVYDFVEHGGRPWLVMEYLASRSLGDLLTESGTLPVEEVARIGVLLASAPTAAHKADIVHRDVKPANVLISDNGAVKLTDFGISRATGDTTVTATGIVMGTVSFIAPEVARGQASDARSDVYSLGATLYSAVEGQPPFGVDDNAIALLYRIAHEEIIPAGQAGALGPVLMWMLERDPELRPTTSQVYRALDDIARPIAAEATTPADEGDLAPGATRPSRPSVVAAEAIGTPAKPRPPAPKPKAVRAPREPSKESGPRRRNALFIGIVAALALAVIAGTALLVLHNGGKKTVANGGLPTSTNQTTAPGQTTAPTSPQLTTPPQGSTQSGATSASTSVPTPTGDVSSQLTSTIVDYYQLMPANTAKGWTWMTADYQQNHANGYNNYQSFWAGIQSVSVTDVVATLPSTVVATIHYTNKSGSTDVERTSFGLVQVQGVWKIASSSVLSHQGG